MVNHALARRPWQSLHSLQRKSYADYQGCVRQKYWLCYFTFDRAQAVGKAETSANGWVFNFSASRWREHLSSAVWRLSWRWIYSDSNRLDKRDYAYLIQCLLNSWRQWNQTRVTLEWRWANFSNRGVQVYRRAYNSYHRPSLWRFLRSARVHSQALDLATSRALTWRYSKW